MKVIPLHDLPTHFKYVTAYTVREDGQVQSNRNPLAYVIQRPHPNGYLFVDLSHGGLQERVFVHVLVAMRHVPRPDGATFNIRHLNGNLHDNRAVNLAWDTGVRNCPACGQCLPTDIKLVHPSVAGRADQSTAGA
jgi:hypothetical protein